MQVGQIARVKAEVWRDWALRSQHDPLDEPPPEQPIISIRTDGVYAGYIMLAYPFWWWKAEELEMVGG